MNPLMSALGFLGDSLDRPGAAVRGLLAGRPDQLAYLVPGAESLGLVDPERRVTGQDLLRRAGVVNGDEDSWGAMLGGMAVDTLTNPLTYLPLVGAAAGGSRFSPMKALREQFPMAYGKDARIAGGTTMQKVDAAKLLGQVDEINAGIAPGAAKVGGAYNPARGVGAISADAPSFAGRHEVIHGLVDQAAKNPEMAGGMPWLVRMAARMQPANPQATGFGAAVGNVADELAAHTLQNRGVMGQLGGAAKFLFGRPGEVRNVYAQQFAEQSPLVGALYRSMGYAPAAGAGAGIGLGAGLAINQMGQP